MELPTCRKIRKCGDWSISSDVAVLSFEQRFFRRKVITTAREERILVDLEHATNLLHGDAFELADGRFIEIIADEEDLLEIKGNLIRLAWHIGNRHMPCQIEESRLLIQHDHVMRDMLEKLNAALRDVHEPFTPEGGAYGHGRTQGHSHG